VIKLLRAFYGATDDLKRRTDICTKLVLRMFDEDDTVKDLSIKTLEELWFSSVISQPALQKLRGGGQGPGPDDKVQLLNKVSVIMGVAANFRDRQSPLEDVLHKIMVSKEDAETGQLHERYSEICEALIDGLVDASELPGFVRVLSSLCFHLCHLNELIRLSSTAFEPFTCLAQPTQLFFLAQTRPRCYRTLRTPHP
jgi:cohesin loading factor subunit SCC2